MPKIRKRDTAVYTLRGPKGEITYIGRSNNLDRRAREQRRAGKTGTMRKESPRMTTEGASRQERARLATYRRNHNGQNPRHNKTNWG